MLVSQAPPRETGQPGSSGSSSAAILKPRRHRRLQGRRSTVGRDGTTPPNLGAIDPICVTRSGPAFERGRTDVSDRRVTTPLIVEYLDVVEHVPLRLAVAVKVLTQLALDRREEALQDAVVVAVAAPAHAADDPARREDRLVVLTRVRAALVGVMEEPDAGTAPFQRHVEGRDREMAIIDGADRPAHHEARDQSRMAARYNFPLSPTRSSVVSPTHR